jgi:hypothetical protein
MKAIQIELLHFTFIHRHLTWHSHLIRELARLFNARSHFTVKMAKSTNKKLKAA